MHTTTTEHDSPHKVNYFATYAALLVLLGASIAMGRIGNPYLMNALVFTVAGIKAILVVRNFMHAKFEPWLVTIMLLLAVAMLIVLVAGVSPDVTFKPVIEATHL